MSQIEHAVTPELGKYDFDGECAPHQPHISGRYYNTFTLGIFQWVVKAGFESRPAFSLKPSQLKRTKIFNRVKGFSAKPQDAYDMARRLCAGYNNGTLTPPLSHAND